MAGSGAKVIEEDSDPDEVEAARSGKSHDQLLFPLLGAIAELSLFGDGLHDVISEIQLNVLTAFKTEIKYISNSSKYDESFTHLLQQYSLQFWEKNESEYFSPYVALFQSSMTGKSRMLEQVAQSSFFTVFICLRTKSTEMPPKQSKAVLDVMGLASRTSAEVLMTCLIKGYIKEFMHWLNSEQRNSSKPTPENWHKYQTNEVDQLVGDTVNRAIFNTDYDWGFSDWATVSNGLKQFYNESHSLDILFIFDEARELLNRVDKNNRTLFRYLE